jgi:vacuolar-type H+-ATPase subunit I/STV1
VLAAESADNGANLVEFAVEQPFWKAFIEKNESFRQEKATIVATFDRRLEELEERRNTITEGAYVRACNDLAAQREAQIKELQREHTRRMRPR